MKSRSVIFLSICLFVFIYCSFRGDRLVFVYLLTTDLDIWYSEAVVMGGSAFMSGMYGMAWHCIALVLILKNR